MSRECRKCGDDFGKNDIGYEGICETCWVIAAGLDIQNDDIDLEIPNEDGGLYYTENPDIPMPGEELTTEELMSALMRRYDVGFFVGYRASGVGFNEWESPIWHKGPMAMITALAHTGLKTMAENKDG